MQDMVFFGVLHLVQFAQSLEHDGVFEQIRLIGLAQEVAHGSIQIFRLVQSKKSKCGQEFKRVDPLAEFLPGINSYAYAINNPILFNDRFGLYPSLANGTNQVAKCETCPNGENYDVYRESKSQFTYIDGMVVNGDGSGPTAHAQRNNNSYNFFYEFGMGSAGTAEYFLGKRIENIAKWDGTHRYGGAKNVLSQAEIDAKAIARQPLIKNRPINILRQYALPRNQALKLAKGLKFAGSITALYTVTSSALQANAGEITNTHALTTIGLTALGIGAATLSAPIAVPAIILGGLYGYYEDDIWHDYDKANAENFKQK
ncbi:hypothetical protein [Lacihabitans lacunae]|uniref:RHS repeat-associated core domain-containing protein n=1 Tax=Lacihabitans lacunae TaxID=1028214 RepID=A0ABV7Z1A6_9BACT